MDEIPGTTASILTRDPTVSILFGVALFLIVFDTLAIFRFAVSRHPGLLIAALLLTGAFAVVGAMFGLMRGLRSGRATRSR